MRKLYEHINNKETYPKRKLTKCNIQINTKTLLEYNELTQARVWSFRLSKHGGSLRGLNAWPMLTRRRLLRTVFVCNAVGCSTMEAALDYRLWYQTNVDIVQALIDKNREETDCP